MAGHTYQEIGNIFSITREAVRLILKKYPEAQFPYISPEKASKILNIPHGRFVRLCHRAGISPVLVTRHRRYWDPSVIPYLRENFDITNKCYRFSCNCPICGTPVPTDRRIYCSYSCYKEAQKYKNKSLEAREAMKKSSIRWRKKQLVCSPS